jgi:hypothetical protein
MMSLPRIAFLAFGMIRLISRGAELRLKKIEVAESPRVIIKRTAIMPYEPALSTRSRFRAAMILAMAADALQIFVFPMFAEGALSPADDLLDVAVAAVLVHLLGWHWEFLPAFAAELVPGVDLVPFWTLAVLYVYRKWKQITVDGTSSGAAPAVTKAAKFFPTRS